ncbi:MAG: amidohydrolase family protein [Acidimicrobiales bacterium]
MSTRIDAGWVITPSGAIASSSVVFDVDGCITWVGPTGDAPSAERVVDCTWGLVAPGLIDSHTHLGLSWAKALGPTQGHPVYDVFWPRESSLDHDLVRAFAASSAAEALLCGTTCVADHYFFADASVEATTSVGIRSVVGETMATRHVPHHGPQSVRRGIDFVERHSATPLVHPALTPHALDTMGAEALGEVAAEARRLGVIVHMHVAQSEREVALIRSEYGCGSVEKIAELGLLDQPLVAAHAMHASAAELELLASSEAVTTVYCPTVHAGLGRTLPAARLMRLGGRVALGTDAVPTQRRDIATEARVAAVAQQVLETDAGALSVAQAFQMASAAGANALGLATLVGSIEVGKQADLVAHRLDRAAVEPFTDPMAAWTVSGADLVDSVWVDGRRVVEQGRLTMVDETDVAAAAQRARADLFARV